MKKYLPILKDGFTLLVISTIFVSVCNQVFKGLKKNTQSDPLVTAILQDNRDSAKENLTDATRANRPDELGRTPVMWAAYVNLADAKQLQETDGKRAELVALLAQSGADLNLQDRDGWTALMWAAWSGVPQVTARLLENGANLTHTDRQGNTALMIAVQRGNTEVVKALLAQGADGKSALNLLKDAQAKYPNRNEAYQAIASLLSQG
ncbi:MAG: ankyrin repeat domain-containing protein [Oligoflexia bacterium]|nr:ankyrin repeat domain-containing protein [Oligoflexia bacterium]